MDVSPYLTGDQVTDVLGAKTMTKNPLTTMGVPNAAGGGLSAIDISA